MLEVIQEQAWSLWNDYLEPEFGFSEDHLQVTFSGHRGFHLHYRDPKLFHLDSEARRELVSHIRGEGVDVQGGLARFHDMSARGWTQRIRQGMDAMIDTLRSIQRGDEGSGAELTRLESALKSLQDREGNTSQRSASAIKRLAELMMHDGRVQRLKRGNLSCWATTKPFPQSPQSRCIRGVGIRWGNRRGRHHRCSASDTMANIPPR